MRRKRQLAIGVIVSALVATQTLAAPKRKPAAKNPPAKQQPVDPAFRSSYMNYDVGTLRMTGKSRGDFAYNIGKLQMTGRTTPIYDVGPLSMTGRLEP